MTPAEIEARARKVVVDHFASTGHRAQPQDFTGEATFVDLGADSLDVIEITMALEDAFNIEVSDAEAEENKTFGQVVTWLVAKLGPQAVTA